MNLYYMLTSDISLKDSTYNILPGEKPLQNQALQY